MESDQAGRRSNTGLRHTIGLRLGVAGGLLLVLLLATGIMVAGAQTETKYIVQPGDTLSSIATHYNVTVDDLVAANNLPDRSVIYAGQVLTIPPQGWHPPTATRLAGGPTPSGTQVAPTTYTVQPGDTLTGVSARFGLSRQELAAANGISPSSYLYTGQVLKIPGRAQTPGQPTPTVPSPTPTAVVPTFTPVPTAVLAGTPGTVETTTAEPVPPGATPQPGTPIKYTVQPGDTISAIARRFDTTIDAIMSLNNMNDTTIYSGQVLVIVPGNDQSNNPEPTTGPHATPTPSPTPAPPMGKLGPKWIEVDLSSQTLIAYEGQTPVYSTRISSGVARHPTVVGTFRTYLKYNYQRMVGGTGAEHYDLPNVPDVMYFYADYAIHGAYWHNNFGVPMSHGCVNTPLGAGHWLFQWAPIGTTVVSHW